jgi:predicted small metal-binding protein
MKQRKTVEFLKRPLVILVLALLVAGCLFLWYEYRPSRIRANCSLEAEKRADNDEYVYEIIYRHCLRTHGIEYPEQKE